MRNHILARCFAPAMLAACFLSACQTVNRAPIATTPRVDLPRFMGDWYVIASIPTFIERNASNAIESYRLRDDGTIDTTFTFRRGGVDGAAKRYTPRGFVFDTSSNAVWGMRFVWPFKADYRIVYLSDDYQRTIIGRQQRDYVWIMARTPAISDAAYDEMLALVRGQGYDASKVVKVPQQWTR